MHRETRLVNRLPFALVAVIAFTGPDGHLVVRRGLG
jgi:hypothetical protein